MKSLRRPLVLEALTLSNDSGMGKMNRILLKGFLKALENENVVLFTRFRPPITLPSSWTLHITKARPLKIWMNLFFPLWLAWIRPSQVICLGFNLPPLRRKVPHLLFIHDMSPLENLPYRASLHQAENKILFPKMIGRASGFLTNSQYTKGRISALSNIPNEKIFVLPPKTTEAFTLPEKKEDIPLPFSPEKPFVFSLGNIEPRKNFPGLIRAWNKIKDPPLLVIAGHQAWGIDEVNETVASTRHPEKVFLLNRISVKRCNELMEKCTLYVSSSLYEGWGFPLFEALKQKAPCLYHENSSQREFAEGFAQGTDCGDEESFSTALVNLLENPGKLKSLKQKVAGFPGTQDESELSSRLREALGLPKI